MYHKYGSLSELKLRPRALNDNGGPLNGDQVAEEALPLSSTDSNTKATLSPESDAASVSSSSLRRPRRPPDLDLTNLNLTPIQHRDITIHTTGTSGASGHTEIHSPLKEEDPPSTQAAVVSRAADEKGRVGSPEVQPSSDWDASSPNAHKHSGSMSERVSLVPISQKVCKFTTVC